MARSNATYRKNNSRIMMASMAAIVGCLEDEYSRFMQSRTAVSKGHR